jgi:hypothetical protein
LRLLGAFSIPWLAAKYYRQRFVKRVLISNASAEPAENLGAMPFAVEGTRRILLKRGVASRAIATFGGVSQIPMKRRWL